MNCYNCTRPATRGIYCETCANHNRDYQSRRRALNRELGLCIDNCGRRSRPNRVRCKSCAERHGETGRKRYAAKKGDHNANRVEETSQ